MRKIYVGCVNHGKIVVSVIEDPNAVIPCVGGWSACYLGVNCTEQLKAQCI